MRSIILLALPLAALWCADAPHFPTPTADERWATALKAYFDRVGAIFITLHLADGKTIEIKDYSVQGTASVIGNGADGTAVLVRAGAIDAVTYKPDREAVPKEPAKP
jgi:hypothetical protein